MFHSYTFSAHGNVFFVCVEELAAMKQKDDILEEENTQLASRVTKAEAIIYGQPNVEGNVYRSHIVRLFNMVSGLD